MAEKQDTERSEEREVKNLPEKKVTASEEKEVRGGYGPVDSKTGPPTKYSFDIEQKK
jgi:hypothetical protein